MTKANTEIRTMMKENGIYAYQVADAMKIHDSAFSKMMRKELDIEKKEMILNIITELKENVVVE